MKKLICIKLLLITLSLNAYSYVSPLNSNIMQTLLSINKDSIQLSACENYRKGVEAKFEDMVAKIEGLEEKHERMEEKHKRMEEKHKRMEEKHKRMEGKYFRMEEELGYLEGILRLLEIKLEEKNEPQKKSEVSEMTFAAFKSKVNRGEFSSVDTFKKNMGLQNATSFDTNYIVCNLNSYDAYEAGEDAELWVKTGDFFTPSLNARALNTRGCSFHFKRTMFGGSIMREDGEEESDVLASLKDIVNSATAGSKVGKTSFNIVKDGVSYTIDLRFPISLNPIYKYETDPDGATYYHYYNTQYGY